MPSTWPLYLRRLMQETTIYFAQCYEITRQRTIGNPSSFKRLMTQRDDTFLDAALCQREIAVLRRNREKIPQHQRPHYFPRDRSEILQTMRLRGWSIRRTAEHFVLHHNTVSTWCRAWLEKENVGLFFGSVPWNKMSNGVRWAVHQLRSLCLEEEFGTRSIAMHLIRNGIQISRSTIQRFLRRKQPPCPPRPARPLREPAIPHGILRPRKTNTTWHLDFTTLDFLLVRFYVAAVLDGFSRKLLALKVFHDAPSTPAVLRLLRKTIGAFGSPRFLVTDHGCQFRERFKNALRDKLGIKPVKGKVRSYYMNGKVERFFRTFKWWKILTLFYPSKGSIQKKLDTYRDYYNTKRPQWGLQGRTPDEVWNGVRLPDAVPMRERDPVKPAINIKKRRYRGDPHLPVLEVEVIREAKRAA